MRAIAAMARNRVIGRGDTIPWRIPDEFRWFRRTTLGHVLVMGQRTFASLPKPLDGRITVVLTRRPEGAGPEEALRSAIVAARAAPGGVAGAPPLDPAKLPAGEVHRVSGLDALDRAGALDVAWLCGGASLYEQFLPRCSELYLSLVDRDAEGDVLFPAFEPLFDPAGVLLEHPEFRVLRYVRNTRPA
jgi:dihydrofolate reductase